MLKLIPLFGCFLEMVVSGDSGCWAKKLITMENFVIPRVHVLLAKYVLNVSGLNKKKQIRLKL